MAARATRSASRKARVTEAVATGPLGALSHDELGVIVDGLADPLQPVVAVALSSTCLGLRTPLRAVLEVLKEQHEQAMELCDSVLEGGLITRDELSCSVMRGAYELNWELKGLNAWDMWILGMILGTRGLPKLHHLFLNENEFGDTGMKALCKGLDRGATPSLMHLDLRENEFGPAGATAFAAALRRGSLPKLEHLDLGGNDLNEDNVAALVATLRKLPCLKTLSFEGCGIGDEGVASLLAGLGKDDFKALTYLTLENNQLTNKSCVSLISAIKVGCFPGMHSSDDEAGEGIGVRYFIGDDFHTGRGNPAASDEAVAAVKAALDEAIAMRANA